MSIEHDTTVFIFLVDEVVEPQAVLLKKSSLKSSKVGCIYIRLDHVPIAKIHLLAAAMTGRRFLQILQGSPANY